MIQLLFSPQPRMVKGALKKLMATSCPHPDPMNFVSLDLGVHLVKEVADECLSLPLGYDKKTVVAENCFFLEKGRSKPKYQKGDDPKALLAYLTNPDPSIDLYLLVYSDTLDEKGDFFKALLADGAHINPVSEFTKEQWHDYIARFFAKRGISIDNLAIAEIEDRIEGDYARFLNEGQKLAAYSGGAPITKKDVETLVSEPLEDDAFKLGNALSRGDIKNALRIYQDLQVFSAEPVALIRLLANQFRFLNQVRYLQSSGLSNSQIAGALQSSQMRVNIALDNLRKMSEESMNNALDGLYECEKSIFLGQDPELAFTLYLTNFSL
jgi:DNA polymerase III subunit delta